jgi:hypothetical protein
MSEELKDIFDKIAQYTQLGDTSVGIRQASIIIVEEKISSLVAIDEQMSDAMVSYARDNAIEPETALLQWHQTSWHKIIQEQVDHLRELRKELR